MRRSARLSARRYRYRQESPWRTIGAWLGRILFSPLVIGIELVKGRGQARSDWVRGFLLFGVLLMVSVGVVILSGQAYDREVFAALARFDAPDEPAPKSRPYAAEINAAASHFGVSPMAVAYIVEIESGGRPTLVSRKGARGLMQIMPATWRELNPESACRGNHAPGICQAGDDCIFSSWGNIRTGTQYFSRLIEINHGDYIAALQAYNAGQSHVVFSPQAKFPETRRYVASFIRLYRDIQHKHLALRLSLSRRLRQLVLPLLMLLGGYIILATCYFWRCHRRVY
ncbi:MAG: lytic transglycosylase domain-containing protein [Bacteroidota bacterium]